MEEGEKPNETCNSQVDASQTHDVSISPSQDCCCSTCEMGEGEEGCLIVGRIMDFLTQQFIAAAKHLRDEVTALRESIDALRDQQERHYQQQQTQKSLPQPPFRVEAEVHEQPAAQRKKRTRENLNLGIQTAVAIGSIAAFFATAYYAGITRKTSNEIKKQTPAIEQSGNAASQAITQAEQHFRAEERP